MAQQGGAKFVRVGATVFAVLAWVALTLQVIMGLILLIGGGPAVPIGGVEVPARVIGALNFVAATIYWFLFMFVSKVARLLLDVHGSVTKSSAV